MPIVYQIFPVHVKKRISFFFAFSSSCSSAKFCLGTKLATYRSFNPFIINLLREDVEKEHRTSSNKRKTMDWLVFFSRCHDCLGKVAHILLIWGRSRKQMRKFIKFDEKHLEQFVLLADQLIGWLGSRLKSNAKVIKIDRNNNYDQLICTVCCSVGLCSVAHCSPHVWRYQIECVCIVVVATQNVKQ